MVALRYSNDQLLTALKDATSVKEAAMRIGCARKTLQQRSEYGELAIAYKQVLARGKRKGLSGGYAY